MINLFATAAESVKTESAGVAEAVEHFFALGEFAYAASRVALVEVIARLVTVFHVDGEQYAVFVDDDWLVGNFAKDCPGAQRQAFFFADFGIATFVNAPAMRLFGQEFVNVLAVDFGPGGENFYGVDVCVLVDDAAGNSVVFCVDQAECAILVLDVEPAAFAGGNCPVENVAKEVPVYLYVFTFAPERPEAASDLRFGGICG